MAKLRDYVLSLSKDSDAFAAYKANPMEATTNAGLTPDQQDVLLSGDPQQLSKALQSESGEASVDMNVIVVTLVYTHIKHIIAVDSE